MKAAKSKGSKAADIRPRHRMYRGDEIVMGPGKAQLLALLQETGSITEAARRMEMSYNRAWLHIKVMNAAFAGPLVASTRGGSSGGGALLTELGVQVLALWQRLEEESQRATEKTRTELMELVRRK